MKRLIVYFSLEGNTEYIANKLADMTGADKLNLVPVKAFADKGFAKFFWGGKAAVMAEKAFAKLKTLLGIDDFYETAVFIDPKEKPSEENDLKLDLFSKKILQ